MLEKEYEKDGTSNEPATPEVVVHNGEGEERQFAKKREKGEYVIQVFKRNDKKREKKIKQ